jgi:predicted Fe-Mo cluster-binding NifX family protein
MRVAIPQWQGRVSPVFDVAGMIVVADVTDNNEKQRQQVSITAGDPFQRADCLRELGVHVLICGAVTRLGESALVSMNIQVIPYTCGRVDEVLHAFLHGRLESEAFLMPGCDNRIRKSHIRRILARNTTFRDTNEI